MLNRQTDITAQLRRTLTQKWPEAIRSASALNEAILITGLEPLDRLFPRQGLPYGQLIEITGGESSGKTSLMLKILAALSRIGPAVYVDFSGSFFPAAAAAAGVEIAQLLLLTPENLAAGLRGAELILNQDLAATILLDLVGQTGPMPHTIIHRLRQQITRSRGMLLFLTENNRGLIPASMVSLRLEVHRLDPEHIEAVVVRSRICREGHKVELEL